MTSETLKRISQAFFFLSLSAPPSLSPHELTLLSLSQQTSDLGGKQL